MNQNLRCPGCGGVALSALRKVYSSELFPAHCRSCGSLVSAQRTWATALIDMVIAHVLYIGGAVVSLLMWSWWPMIAAVAFDTVLIQPLLGARLPLTLRTPDTTWRWRRNAAIATVVFVVLVVLAGVATR